MSKMFHVPEPKLTFGYDQKLHDPRDGLILFGPFSRKKISGQVNVGIIGPARQRKHFKEYLQKTHRPIFPEAVDKARPYFPGLEAVFGIYINFDNIIEIEINIAEIEKYLRYTDGHQRVHNLTNLYAIPLDKYMNQEEVPVTVWFVVIPDSIYRYGRPKSHIPNAEDNIKDGLKKKLRNINQSFLFDNMNKMQEAYEFEVNFHHQLKAKLLTNKIVTQIIKESTIAYEQLWDDSDRIKAERKFDSAKAWNIATTLYYKVGGTPWKLGEIREKVCYLGLVYKKTDMREDNTNACCAAQMFLDSGDGMVFRGNLGPWYNPDTKEYHLKKKDAHELLSQSLEAFINKSGFYPEQIFIHARTNFNDDEWEGFSSAAASKTTVVGIKIRSDGTFKIYRDYSYCVPRGTVLQVTDTHGYMWSRGFVPRLQTQMGLEVPNPLSIEIVRGAMDFKTVCRDILSLTKLNYNACIFADGLPVTLRFADSIGEILTAGTNVKTDVLTFKHYI